MTNRAGYFEARTQARRDAGLCTRCGKHPREDGKHTCRICRAYSRERAASLSDEKKEEYRQKAKTAAQTVKHKEKERARHKARRQNMKRLIMDHYGSKCVCCGETELVFLTIDHINNDGQQHRKRLGDVSRFYEYIIKAGFPDDLQILCWNCNEAKRILGHCPHGNGI